MAEQSEVDGAAQIIWDYHLMNHELVKSDCIFILGSNDPRVAEHGAQLYLHGWASLLIISGGVGTLTEGLYGCSEAGYFADIAVKMGVPEDSVIIEAKATNTGENIVFMKQLLLEKGLSPETFILIQKPFMERRTYATFAKQWPEKKMIISSPPISYTDYPNESLSREDILNVMVGDLQRIREYPRLGFQIEQEIPDFVWSAYEKLVSWGFDKHLIK